jgi:hypothetical protein
MKVLLLAAMAISLSAQVNPNDDSVLGFTDTPLIPGQKWRVHDRTRPYPPKVKPGLSLLNEAPPSDAIVLFGGKDLSQWQQIPRPPQTQAGGTPPAQAPGQPQAPKWKVTNGYMEIVPRTGRLVTKQKFGDCQLHIEWMIPKQATGIGQGIGNSGVELMGRYEIQVLESYKNLTYSDGGAGAMYGEWPPLVNPARAPGEWNVYDIIFEAPRFEGDKLVKPAYFTVFWNGLLVHNHREQMGTTAYKQVHKYTPHAAQEPLSLQDHSQPVRFRNIWIRPLKPSDEP